MKTLIISALVYCTIWLAPAAGCGPGKSPDIPTGLIKKEQLDDGSYEIIAVGKASYNALRKDLIAMKQATSREAAELLVLNALRELGETSSARARLKMKVIELRFLHEGAYCRLRVLYFPRGLPDS